MGCHMAEAREKFSFKPYETEDCATGWLDRVEWLVKWRWWDEDYRVYIEYAGTAEDLIEAGCVTRALIAPYAKGKRIVDADGDTIHRTFRKGWMRVNYYKALDTALRLPAVTMNTIHVAQAFSRAEQRRRFGGLRTDIDTGDLAPKLRLVVNNDSNHG